MGVEVISGAKSESSSSLSRHVVDSTSPLVHVPVPLPVVPLMPILGEKVSLLALDESVPPIASSFS